MAGSGTWTAGQVNSGNSAALSILAGGSLDIQGDVGFFQNLGGSSSFNNSGILQVTGPGTLTIGGAFSHQAGAMLRGTGTLSVTTIAAFDGDVNPGTSPGVLNITGDLPQSFLSTTTIDVEGTTVGTGFDQLNVSGAATLNGPLIIEAPVMPEPGFAYNVLNTGSRTGAFSSVAGRDLVPTLGRGLALDTAWTATSLDLVARGQILFHANPSNGSGGIFRSNTDGTLTTNVTTEFSITGQGHPRWSPDYRWVTYGGNVSASFGVNFLHITAATGEPDVFHIVNDVNTRRARFSPDGRHIAFECSSDSSYGDVCTVTNVDNPFDGQGDGEGKVFVTAFSQLGGPGVFAWNPLNPNQLAVVRDTTNALGQPTQAVYTVNFDGGGVSFVQILPGFSRVGGTMDWSPDGTLLALGVEVSLEETTRLYTLNMTDGALTPLTNGGDQSPVFSPDGSRILFVRGLDACDAKFWTVRPDGTDQVQLTGDNLCDNTDVLGHDWSPDGNWIVLVGSPSGGQPNTIYVVPSTVTAATYTDVRRAIRAANPEDGQPSWRP